MSEMQMESVMKGMDVKMKIIVADTTSLVRNGMLYGHGKAVAKSYFNALNGKCDIQIAGGSGYKKEIENVLTLPFNTDEKDSKIKKIFKGFANSVVTLFLPADAIIFQNQYITPLLLAINMFPFKKNIYVIYYNKPISNSNTEKEKHLFEVAQKKIKGILTSIGDIEKETTVPICQVPDYFPTAVPEKAILGTIDFVILGTASWAKNYEMVVQTLNESEYSCVIAGKFEDENRYEKLVSIAKKNIKIYNKYISDVEYKSILSKARYVVLPYDKEHYKEKSSGVVLEALYAGKPVIAPRIQSFLFVEEYGIGLLYDNSIDEIIDECNSRYSELVYNIKKYVEQEKESIDDLIRFIKDNNY